MITYKDIRIAINNQLIKTSIDINSRDVTEGFNRPSFFVQLDNARRFATEIQVQREISVYIYYFPTDRYEYDLENLEMQEVLEGLFNMKLAVKDRLFNIDNFSTNTTDGVLYCRFDLEFWDMQRKWLTEQEEQGKMEELTTNISKE